jgi:hypothetical protein
MRVIRFSMTLTLLGALPAAAAAQAPPQPVVYASYYRCNPQDEAAVDSLVRTFWAPLVERQIAAKNATTWGWISHHTGGTWSRAFYVVSPDVGKAVDAIEGLVRDGSANAQAMRATTTACPSHEDYIWQRHSGSQPPEQLAMNRPAAAFSVYYECTQGREGTADSLLTSAFAPVLNRAVQRGDLNAWTWQQHLVGGKYRRSLIMDGRDAKAVIMAQARISGELFAQQGAAMRQFGTVCPTHQDAVWNISGK